MPQITEFHIQRAVCIMLDKRGKPGLEYWHTPNGGKRSGFEAKRFKEMGVKPGVHDLLLFDGRLFLLELKDDDGELSPAQRDWRDRMVALGAIAGWANSLPMATAWLEQQQLLISC